MNKKVSARKVFIIMLILSVPFFYVTKDVWHALYLKVRGKKTVQEVVDKIGNKMDENLGRDFARVNAAYPPESITLIAYKKDRVVELWCTQDEKNIRIKSYIVHKDSGTEGPKLKEGDGQVPEGIYTVKSLNPNSRFYLSLELNYPNEFDMKKADLDSRKNPGQDIFIHGKAWSVGCLAMGDEQIEEIFILTAKIGRENVKVVIAPNREVKSYRKDVPRWTPELYEMIRNELEPFTENRIEKKIVIDN